MSGTKKKKKEGRNREGSLKSTIETKKRGVRRGRNCLFNSPSFSLLRRDYFQELATFFDIGITKVRKEIPLHLRAKKAIVSVLISSRLHPVGPILAAIGRRRSAPLTLLFSQRPWVEERKEGNAKWSSFAKLQRGESKRGLRKKGREGRDTTVRWTDGEVQKKGKEEEEAGTFL